MSIKMPDECENIDDNVIEFLDGGSECSTESIVAGALASIAIIGATAGICALSFRVPTVARTTITSPINNNSIVKLDADSEFEEMERICQSNLSFTSQSSFN